MAQEPAAPLAAAAASQFPAAPEAMAPDTDEAVRAKRPARVQRTRENGEPVDGEPVEPDDAGVADGASAETTAAPSAGAVPAAAPSSAPQSSATQPAGAQAPTATTGAPGAAVSADRSASAPRGAALVDAPEGGYLDDGLSWPLPPNIIVGGRYRVEAVVSAAPGPAGENVYRVKDLQGYERCWSCGATYDTPERSVPEQFCRECGADMLGRPYILRERLVTESATESATQDATDDEPSLPGEQVFRQGRRRFSIEPEEPELPPFPLGAHVIIASASDIGRERAAGQNEDGVGQLILQIETESRAEPLALAIVADGLGGHASGREASRTVVRTMLRHVLGEVALPAVAPEATPPTKDALKQALREAILAANDALHAVNDASERDMGSTVVAALISDDTALVANVGDSRAYVFDGGELRRLTADHSLVEQLVSGGMIAPEERYTHPNRNQIFRSLGAGAERGALGIDLFTQRLRPGMRLLLCSDGLWEMVHDEELARILRETPNPQAACDALIHAANERGGEDNISALIVEISR